MTLVDNTAKSQTDTLSFEFDLRHSPEKVWRALTEPALLAEWLLPVVGHKLELDPGSSFAFKTQAYGSWDGTVNCQILESEAPKRLRYKWVVGDMLDTVVTFTLTPTGTGTRLALEHTGFKPEQKQNFAGARYGWKMMSDRLVELLPRVS